MLPAWFVIFSVLIRLFGGTQYIWGVLKGKARPNAVTWFLWGLTPLITFFAQLQYGWSGQSFVLLALAASPLAVSVIAIAKHPGRHHFTPVSITCGLMALLGIALWQITSVPELAIVFSIVADIFATLPTLHKAYYDQDSEYAMPYLLSMLSMIITLLTIHSWIFAVYAFPLYMLSINTILFVFAALPIRNIWHRSRKLLQISN